MEVGGVPSIKIFSGITPLSRGNAYCGPDEGIPFIRSGQITADGEISTTHEVWIRPEIHAGLMKNSQLCRDDVLIAIVGATIGAAGVYECDDPANINQAIAAIRLRTNCILPWFLVFRFINSITYQVSSRSNFFHRNGTGSSLISAIPLSIRSFNSSLEVTRM